MKKTVKSFIVRLDLADFLRVSKARSIEEAEAGYALSWREFILSLVKKAGY